MINRSSVRVTPKRRGECALVQTTAVLRRRRSASLIAAISVSIASRRSAMLRLSKIPRDAVSGWREQFFVSRLREHSFSAAAPERSA